MRNYSGRTIEFKNKLNNHLSKLTGVETDYYSKLKSADLLKLKTVLSDINNLLTLKLTVASTDWICEFFNIQESYKSKIIETIDLTKPNETGFDILIQEPIKLIGEVKCTIPINNGNRFGVAQSNSILDDIHKLKKGKKQLQDTSEYVKFIFLIDLGEKTYDAIKELLRQRNIRIETQIPLDRNIARETALVFEDMTKVSDLDKKRIFIKAIKLE